MREEQSGEQATGIQRYCIYIECLNYPTVLLPFWQPLNEIGLCLFFARWLFLTDAPWRQFPQIDITDFQNCSHMTRDFNIWQICHFLSQKNHKTDWIFWASKLSLLSVAAFDDSCKYFERKIPRTIKDTAYISIIINIFMKIFTKNLQLILKLFNVSFLGLVL